MGWDLRGRLVINAHIIKIRNTMHHRGFRGGWSGFAQLFFLFIAFDQVGEKGFAGRLRLPLREPLNLLKPGDHIQESLPDDLQQTLHFSHHIQRHHRQPDLEGEHQQDQQKNDG